MSLLRLVLESLRWLSGFALLWSVPACRRGSHEDGVTAVVIPARNEEANLPRLLASLPSPRPGQFEVVVVDDDSDDRTAAVAAEAGALVLAAPPLPPGANGKAAACAVGASAAIARGASRLIFLDADCMLGDDGLERLLDEHTAVGGLLSVQPYHVTERAYERLSIYFNVVAMMGVGAFAIWRPRVRGAFGPCLVTTSSDYVAAGGHGGVAGAVLDDVALARAYRAGGIDVHCRGGRGSVRFRMYPDGFRPLVEGWSKNFASGASTTNVVVLLLVVAWMSGAISAGWTLFTAPMPYGVAVYTAYAVQLGVLARRLGRFGWWPLLFFPVPLAFFLFVFARSLVLTYVVRSVRWKGRNLSARGRSR